jgi:hypothetical protein
VLVPAEEIEPLSLGTDTKSASRFPRRMIEQNSEGHGMSKHLWSNVLIGLIIVMGSRVHAQAGPYDQAKAQALAGDIEGVKLGMPLAEARQRLTGAGYVTPPRPSGGVSARGRAIAPPCSPQKPPVEEERYHYPNVPRDHRELILQY